MEQNNQQQQQQFKCSGDCLKCLPVQRQYCASQFTYNTMRMVESLQNTLITMQGTVEDLKTKIEAIQSNEASVFDPTKDEELLAKPTETNIAQEGAGV